MNEITGSHSHSETAAGNCRISTRGSNGVRVHVVASDGRVLNSCHPARARELIRKGRALRLSRHPYTIRLLGTAPQEAEAQSMRQAGS
ncbi:RRXRR domain-containing protein [Methylosarcina fibrata]|uniref:RRXRR domain-containing protein n=1 Tax=Methylosarcina fibrata TaxID=105972 RepID=UPI001E59BB4C|nr:RRXRR domain-containing protein [Methylosarcina fibrata]